MAKNKGRPQAAPPTEAELVSLIRAIADKVEAEGCSTIVPYRLTAAVRMSLALAEARLRVADLPPE